MTVNDKFLSFRDEAEAAYPPLKNHLQPLYDYALEAPGKLMLELGSETGTSSVALLYAAAEKDKILYSVDISWCDNAHNLIKARDLHQYWEFLQEDDRNLSNILEQFNLSEAPQFGLIFIDTSHEYEHTKKEIELYSPLVSPGGFLIFHDFQMPEVKQPVMQLLAESTDFAPYQIFTNSYYISLIVCKRKSRDRETVSN